MKVLKVLVDELPEHCYLCNFYRDGFCCVTGDMLDYPLEERPDWCPLRDIQEVDGHNLYWWQSEALGGENNE